MKNNATNHVDMEMTGEKNMQLEVQRDIMGHVLKMSKIGGFKGKYERRLFFICLSVHFFS